MSEIGQKIAKLYEKQISLTEWLENIKHKSTIDVRAEDNAKLDRLRQVNKVINLPYDEPVRFASTELNLDNLRLIKFLETDGDRLCALRLMPNHPGRPKLRMRGLSVRGAFEWFQQQLKQGINPTDYTSDFRSHADEAEWSSIFIINEHGISGEVIRDRLHHLSQGFYDDATPLIFHYDWETWRISPHDDGALNYIKKIVKHLYVPDVAKQKLLSNKIGATFTHDYLFGYFETIEAEKVFGLHFEDYSQNLGEMYRDFVVNIDEIKEDHVFLRGRGASAGIARGEAKIIRSPDDDFAEGSVLVAKVTTPDLVALMKKSAAIITDKGGILSHAAIIARELGKPCVVDAGDATSKLRDGQTVEVDGAKGTIKIIEEEK